MIQEGYILYVADTETTGFSPTDHEVIELSMIRMRFTEIGPVEEEQRTWLIRATKPETIQDEALSINGHTREDILHMTKVGKEKYLDPLVALTEIENWIANDDVTINDRVLVAQNAIFDYEHLESMWMRHGLIDTFPFKTGHNKQLIDTKSIALFIDVLLGKRRKYYNLGKLVKAYGVKSEKAHRADADTRMTKDLFIKQAKPFITSVRDVLKDISFED